jgi:hypothetical protein
MKQASDINTAPEKSEEENGTKTKENKEKAEAINRDDALTSTEVDGAAKEDENTVQKGK